MKLSPELAAALMKLSPELGGADEAVAVLVEDAERLTQLVLAVLVLHLARHHVQELLEVDGAVTCNHAAQLLQRPTSPASRRCYINV